MRKMYIYRGLLLAFLLGMQLHLWATSTEGAVVRALNIDGFVAAGAVPGANNTSWETDEVFQGFNNAVNWYLTWDEDNLYLGRIAGSNEEGSIIYVRAEFPGAVYADSGQVYDDLGPELTPMGGVNFAAYLKGGPGAYDEFRTYDSTGWSAPDVSLNPLFTTQGGGTDHMEVRIPWDAVTNGNGKPANVRLVLYQVVPRGVLPNCADEFVYAESPWGTGNPGDGPSVGVNDGVPTSARQPGGCNVGDSTATRWWGCYPVIGGVGSNGWVATLPDAGPDTILCENATAYPLGANQPPVQSLGEWAVASQPAGSPPVVFSDQRNPLALVSNLTGFGDYVLIWDINYGGCPSMPDTVVISRYADPPPAIISANVLEICESDSAVLTGNNPGPQVGGLGGQVAWSLVSGQGSISTPGDTQTVVFNLGYGANVFEYSIANGPCGPSTAQVTITRYAPPFADAGPDQELCANSLTTLSGSDPAQIQLSAVGTWTQINGPSQAVFTNPAFFNTNVSGLQTGTYLFQWSVANGLCGSVEDTVQVTIYDPPVADAGGDILLCEWDTLYMDANDPLGLAATAAGTWRLQAGPGIPEIFDSTLYNTGITDLQEGTYKFSWSMSNGTCPVANDVVSVTLAPVVAQGIASFSNPDEGMSNGSVEVNPPSGTAPFSYNLNGGSFQSSPLFENLPAGLYFFTLRDSLGCEDTISFELKENIIIPPPEDSLLIIPTGFSPNGDGVNDTWEIPGIELHPNAVIEVYNIWGARVYLREGGYQGNEWNGTYQGQEMPAATYYYVIQLRDEEAQVLKGSITLFR